MRFMDYVMVIHQAEEGGYWAEFPALPGCFTQGETVEEVLEDAPDAVGSHLDALRDDGQQIPPTTGCSSRRYAYRDRVA